MKESKNTTKTKKISLKKYDNSQKNATKVKKKYDSYVKNGNSNSIIKQLFKWKDKEIKDNKYCVPLNAFITDILRVNDESYIEQFQEIIETSFLIEDDYVFEKNTYYLSWNTIIDLIDDCSKNEDFDIDQFTFKITLLIKNTFI